MAVIAIVPSLNPDEKLELTVRGLLDAGFDNVLLVDDGSDDAHRAPFDTLETLPQVTVLRHECNAGKGRAMKTAFAYVLEHHPRVTGVVTVDGDGQHAAEDVRRLADAMEDKPCIWLGVRDFNAPQVPSRSRFGNKASCLTMRLLCGLKVSDTQTGLRAFPTESLPWLLEVPGDRYEFETNMLLEMQQRRTPFDELTIHTIYIEENATSHFRPLADGWRIYRRMLAHFLRFTASGLVSFAVDALLFWLLAENLLLDLPWKWPIVLGTVVARVLSSLLNYTLNHKVVFRSRANPGRTLLRYYILCVCQMLASAVLVAAFSFLLPKGFAVTLLKVLVDLVLFFVSFRIQQRYVFGSK